MNDFFCTALEDRIPRPDLVFLFNIILAFLALPALTSLSLGEYKFRSPRLSWFTRLRRWSFLTAKIALLLPAVFFVALDLAYLPPAFTPSSAQSIQRVAWFLLCLFGFRWAVRDQRCRCPICLSLLGHAARLGHPSKSFLAWNGTELACSGGHGLLQIPGAAHQLVQHAALAAARRLLAGPLSRTQRRHRRMNGVGATLSERMK